MILYIDRGEIQDVENLSPGVLEFCITEAEAAGGRYGKLMKYYLGKHKLPKTDNTDNIPVIINYAKYIVDTILGYYLGESVKYDANKHRVRGEHILNDSDSEQAETVAPIDEEIDISPLIDAYTCQKIGRVDLEIGRTMGIMGDCLEVLYASNDKDPHPKSARVSPNDGILVCDTTYEHNKMFAVLWDHRKSVTGVWYYYISVYTDKTVKHYKSIDKKPYAFDHVGQDENHYFGAVPVIAYLNNEQRQGDFEQVMPIIDAYNQLMTDRVTDKRKFVDSVLAIFGATLTEKDGVTLKDSKMIDGLPLDARIEYIQKVFNEAEVQTLATALVREIHKMSMTVDMSDENFAGNVSGQALKLKLLTMSLLTKSKIRQMEKGLQERFSMYNHWLTVMGEMKPVGVNDVDIRFTLSLPINEQEIVQIVKDLQGIVDDQTLLSLLWFVTDPAEALENIKRQKAENVQTQQQLFKSFSKDEESKAEKETDENLKAVGESATEKKEPEEEPEKKEAE